MSDTDTDVAVIGLGAWGAATLWRLACRGVDVVGIERFVPGHAFGSSHGGSRMFRLTCYEHRDLVPLAQRSIELWTELEAATGVALVERSGGLLVGPEDGRMIAGTLAHAREFGIEVERLAPAAVAERFPQHVGIPPHHVGVWEPSAGIVRPEAAVTAAVAASVELGARVLADVRVLRLEPVADAVVLHTATGVIRARRVVVAAGPWCASLVAGLPVRVIRKPVTWFAPAGEPAAFTLERFAMFKREDERGTVLWGCGAVAGPGEVPGVKLGMEARGSWVPRGIDPEVLDRSTTVEDWEALAEVVARSVPGIRPVPTRVSVCMGAHTPDNQFLLGPVDDDARVLVATGESSQGFKHATGVGEYLTSLALDERPVVDLPFTAPDRFGTSHHVTPGPTPAGVGPR